MERLSDASLSIEFAEFAQPAKPAQPAQISILQAQPAGQPARSPAQP